MSRLSVIMPARNASATVQRAVVSVLADREVDDLILVDDGSSDGTASIARLCGDDRLRVVPGPGQGVAAALNAGFDAAEGDLVMRVDADDELLPGWAGAAKAFLGENPDYVAMSGGYEVSEPRGAHLADLAVAGPARDVTGVLRSGRAVTSFCTWVTRRDAIRSTGGARTWFETGEDLDLQFRIASTGLVWHRPVPVYRVYLSTGSLTHRAASDRRAFFDAAAARFARQRLLGGADDLDRGRAPAPPEVTARGPSYGAARHAVDLAVGQTWRVLSADGLLAAFGCLRPVLRLAPGSARAWVCLVRLALRGVRDRIGYLYSISRGARPVSRREA